MLTNLAYLHEHGCPWDRMAVVWWTGCARAHRGSVDISSRAARLGSRRREFVFFCKTRVTTKMPDPSVRRGLAKIRARWQAHSPVAPFCIDEEVEPGVSVADFCVHFLLAQRTRRS